MKKFNLRTGIPFSLLVSVILVLLRLIRIEPASFGMYILLGYYYFFFSILCWTGNIIIINIPFISKPVLNKYLFYFISILAGSLFAILFDYINTALRGTAISISELYDIDPHKRLIVIFFRGSLLNLLNAFFVSHIYQMKKHEQNQLELEHLKQAHLQANLSSLKEQLSPHFMFNTFNTLSSLTNEQSVKDYVDQMANVYRYLLDYQKNDLADLKQEVTFTESYLYIIKTRLEDAMQIHTDIDITAFQYKIPPLTLQLLIENAIKHNVASTSNPLKIDIFTADDYLVVTNNMQPKSSLQSSSGIGLTNIAQRYQLLFNREIKIEMDDHFFTVKLPLTS